MSPRSCGRITWSFPVAPSRNLRRGPSIGLIFLLVTSSLALPPARATTVLAQARSAPTTSSATNDAWQSYRSDRGRFTIEHPAGWTAEERTDAQGALVSTLTAPDSGGISVIVEPGTSSKEANADLMNTRCHPVTVDRRPARTCLDTLSSSLSTTIAGQGKTYIIVGSRRRGGQRIYDRVVASFRILP
jgi:hypothetical protein